MGTIEELTLFTTLEKEEHRNKKRQRDEKEEMTGMTGMRTRAIMTGVQETVKGTGQVVAGKSGEKRE